MKPPSYTGSMSSMLTTRARLGLPPLNRKRRHGRLSTKATAIAIVLFHALLGAVAWILNR